MATFSRETAPLDPWYVTGLCEAGGSFTFSRSGRQIAVYFSIRTGAAGLPLIEALQAFFGGAGTIYPVPGRTASGLAGATASYYYRVCRRGDLATLVEHFDAFPLRGEKRSAFSAWREMALLKQRFRGSTRSEMEALAARLASRPASEEDRA